jgi:hypothetical protein
MKNMFSQNKLGIISLLFFSIMLYLEGILSDTISNSIVIFILTFLAYSVNRIIVTKNYIVTKFNLNYNIEFNNYKTIIFHSWKIYMKYILLFLLFFTIIIVCVFFGIIFKDANRIIDVLGNDIYNDELISEYIYKYTSEYIDPIFESKFTLVFIGFVLLLMFFKLLFIENILVFKQDNYKIKNIVKKSFTIIKTDMIFYIITYFGIGIFLLYLSEILFKNNYIYTLFEGIIDICLFMIYQIKFVEKKQMNINN